MRLLLSADAVGGVWTYAVELGRELSARGGEVHLAVLGPGPSDEQRGAALAAGVASVAHGPFALEWMDDPWPDVARAGDWLLGLADEVAPDVVHLNGFAHAALPWPAPVVVGAHSDVVSWWQAVHRTDAPAAWDRYRAEVRRGLAAADAVIAPSASMARAIATWHGRADVEVVHNGRDSAWVRPAPKQPLLLAAGRLGDAAKNVGAARRAAARVPWPLLTAAGLPFPVLADLLASSSVLVHPARYEPFGLVPLEAAQAGCALVLGDIPSLREVWGGAATYADPEDAGGLRRALLALVEDPRLLADRQAAARERARRYTPARMADGHAAVYARVTARAGAR